MNKLSCLELNTQTPCEIPAQTVIALGNFDGVHVAHRSLIAAAKSLRDECSLQAKVCVFCFRTFPSDFLCENPPKHLSTLEERLEGFLQSGAEYVILAEFEDLMRATPEAFAKDILLGECHAVGAVCGFNYHFAYRGQGSARDLQALLPCQVRILPPFCTPDGEPVSSTRIRNLLTEGRPEEASKLLSRPYAILSPVIPGKRLGRKLGFPTANQTFPPLAVIPKHGVYETLCTVEGVTYRGLTNVGTRPTVEKEATVNCETYLTDFHGDLYGKNVKTEFLRFLRPEKNFSSVEELQKQIQTDLKKL